MAKIYLIDDKLLDHSGMSSNELKQQLERFDFFNIYESHKSIEREENKLICVMLHSSYSPLFAFDEIKKKCFERGILFIQFGGGETESDKITDNYYIVNSTVFFKKLRLFLSSYKEDHLLSPELFL